MTIVQDLRYGLRLLLRSPGYTAVAALSIGLGIGVNTMTFSGINTVLLKPIPVAEPSRTVTIFTTDPRNADFVGAMSRLNFLDYRAKNQVLSGMASMMGVQLALSDTGTQPEILQGQLVTGDFFDVLGVKPVLGRTFRPDEDRTPGTHLVAVLSYNGWQRYFAGDRSVVGRTITLNRQPFTIIGVAPNGFRGLNPFGRPLVWLPSMCYQQVLAGFLLENFESRRGLVWQAVGRLKPGVSIEQARANMTSIASQLELEYPTDNRGRSVRLLTLPESRMGPDGRNVLLATGMLMTIVALVLLVACGNVANLLLARANARRREIALRLALGATRARIVRQLLIESLALATVGGVLALPLSYWGQLLLLAARPPFLPADTLDTVPDARVLAFTAAATVVTGVLFGLVPALRASRPSLVTEIKEGTADPAGGERLFGLRNVLVLAQIAFSLVALIVAGLFVRSLNRTMEINPGFDVERLASLTVDLGTSGYDEARGREFQRKMIERATGVAGVQSAALADFAPLMGGGFSRTVFLAGQDTKDPRNGKLVQIQNVSDAYLQTVGIRLLRGRNFLASDLPTSPHVVIINETMARRFWAGKDPIGERYHYFGIDDPAEVVGVAADSDYNGVGEDRQPFIYQPLSQIYQPGVTLLVRAGQPSAVLGTVRGEMSQLDRQLPLQFVMTMSDAFSQSLFVQRFGAGLLAAFGGLALVLSIIGVYGVMAYSVSRRTREIGIRIALGASQTSLVQSVLRQAARLALVGAAIGVAVSLLLARVIGRLLYGVGAADPVTFVGVPTALVVAAIAASYLPARRAATVDPLVALRHE
ncbi:MAG TPA: ABC transporter permease [Vicinamibacterales bacterium]|jgi:putative ABC transport system permease protein